MSMRDEVYRSTMLLRKYGSTIKIATAITTAKTTVRFMMILSVFSRFAASSSVRTSSSSSSKKPAEYVSVFIPSTRESTKLKMPRIKGILSGVFHGIILL